MKTRKTPWSALLTTGLLAGASLTHAQTVIYEEEFDGTGNGYNPDSATALAGENDWVDFGNRITTDFSGNEGYFTAVGGTETVLTGSTTSGDPQLRSDFSPGVDKTRVGRIEIRARIDVDMNSAYDDALNLTHLSLFWGTGSYVNPGAGNGNPETTFTNLSSADQVVAQSDGWHLFIWDDDGGLGGGTGNTINAFRLDAVNNLIGSSFEVDYFKIEETTLTEVDPVDPIPGEFTLRQEWNWNSDGDAEGWTVGANGHFTLSGVASGLYTGISDGGGDSQLNSPAFQVLDVESGRFIIELGLVVDADDDSEKQLFWKLNGGGADTNQKVTLPSVPSDGAPHVVRINLDDVINGRITGLRYDPSNELNITTNLDYIRIYSEGPEIPFFPPPVTELDPAAPLGPEFLLQEEWTFNVIDNLEGWTGKDLTIAEPNDGTTGVFDGSLFAESTSGDPWLNSPVFEVNAPASQQFVVEIDYPADFGPGEAGQFFWTDDGGGPAPARSVGTPLVPLDASPHTLRITMTNNVDGALRGLRLDSVATFAAYYGVDAVRIYTNGPPVSTEAPQITAFSYDSSTGDAEASLKGNASTVYTFTSATNLDFSSSSPVTLTGATVGMLSGGGVETDGSGNATVQFNLGTDPANFVRAED